MKSNATRKRSANDTQRLVQRQNIGLRAKHNAKKLPTRGKKIMVVSQGKLLVIRHRVIGHSSLSSLTPSLSPPGRGVG
ncbi:MAG TPA: hypothetical protein VK568_07205 [Thermodesulfobacteriota bacterium]|nr:hypothetical protein [Thermodesulfobacteriota bacterium]